MKQRYYHAHVVDPSTGFDGMGELLVEDGVIVACGSSVPDEDEAIDCGGLILAPGLVDMPRGSCLAHGGVQPGGPEQADRLSGVRREL